MFVHIDILFIFFKFDQSFFASRHNLKIFFYFKTVYYKNSVVNYKLKLLINLILRSILYRYILLAKNFDFKYITII